MIMSDDVMSGTTLESKGIIPSSVYPLKIVDDVFVEDEYPMCKGDFVLVIERHHSYLVILTRLGVGAFWFDYIDEFRCLE